MIRTLVNQENTVLIVKSVSFQMVTHSLSHALPCCPDWVMQLLGVLCVCVHCAHAMCACPKKHEGLLPICCKDSETPVLG